MTLFGSLFSPYVRRIRLLLANTPHEFVPLDIYDFGKDREIISRLGSIKKVPVLEYKGVDGKTQIIPDSRVIARFIQHLQGETRFVLEEENQLTVIDAVGDSLVNLFLLKRSGIDLSPDHLYFKLQQDRIHESLLILNKMVTEDLFDQWNFSSMALYCLLDWIKFRSLYELSPYKSLCQFNDKFKNHHGVELTDPWKLEQSLKSEK